jgi:hypothetical protein
LQCIVDDQMDFIKQDPNGLGSRDLRAVLSNVIDIDEDGNAVGVFAAVGNLHLSRVVAIARDEDGDLLLITDHAQAVMEQLDSWDDFVAD